MGSCVFKLAAKAGLGLRKPRFGDRTESRTGEKLRGTDIALSRPGEAELGWTWLISTAGATVGVQIANTLNVFWGWLSYLPHFL